MVSETLVMATHGVIFLTAVAGLARSIFNGKTLTRIEIAVNGSMDERIKAAVRSAISERETSQ